MRYKYILFILFLFLFFNNCDTPFTQEKISEGVIEYDIEFTDNTGNNPIIAILPDKMDMNFKNGNNIAKINGYMGLFAFNYINNADSNISLTLLRIFDKTYIYQGAWGKQAYGYGVMSNIKIEYTNETKKIANYKCHKAIVTFNECGVKPMEVFYTKDISIPNANANNPFKGIDGVLMEFQLNLFNITMKFKAINVEAKKINNADFFPPINCKFISKKKMAEIMKKYTVPK